MRQEIGDRLRRAREERGLSLAEIQNSTKIRLRYLEALEHGEFEVIPGEVYVRGFLQNFAGAVGLDARELLEEYDRGRDGSQAEPMPAQTPVQVPVQAPVTMPPYEPDQYQAGGRRSFPAWGKPALLCMAIALGVGLTIWVLSAVRTTEQNARSTSPAKNETRSAAAAEPRTVEPRPAAKPVPGDEVLVVLRFTGRCWLQVRLDGRLVFSDIVSPGTLQTWRAKDLVAVDFGNAGGVSVEVNGETLGYPGKVGENLHREYRRAQ